MARSAGLRRVAAHPSADDVALAAPPLLVKSTGGSSDDSLSENTWGRDGSRLWGRGTGDASFPEARTPPPGTLRRRVDALSGRERAGAGPEAATSLVSRRRRGAPGRLNPRDPRALRLDRPARRALAGAATGEPRSRRDRARRRRDHRREELDRRGCAHRRRPTPERLPTRPGARGGRRSVFRRHGVARTPAPGEGPGRSVPGGTGPGTTPGGARCDGRRPSPALLVARRPPRPAEPVRRRGPGPAPHRDACRPADSDAPATGGPRSCARRWPRRTAAAGAAACSSAAAPAAGPGPCHTGAPERAGTSAGRSLATPPLRGGRAGAPRRAHRGRAHLPPVGEGLHRIAHRGAWHPPGPWRRRVARAELTPWTSPSSPPSASRSWTGCASAAT